MLEILEFVFSSFWIWLGVWWLVVSPLAILSQWQPIQIDLSDDHSDNSDTSFTNCFDGNSNKPSGDN